MARPSSWQVVENVVAALEGCLNRNLDDLKVTQKALIPMRSLRTKQREVDVLISFKAGQRRIRIGIDVKDEGRPLDVTSLEQLWAKLNDLDLDRRVVVATHGFAKDAAAIFGAKGLDLIHLKEVQAVAWLADAFGAEVRHREFSIVHVYLEYAEGVEQPPLSNLPSATLDGPGGSEMLLDFLARKLGEAIPETSPLWDRPDGFRGTYDMHVAEHLAETRTIRCDRGTFRLPAMFRVQAIGRRVRREVPVRILRTLHATAATMVLQHPTGPGVQLSLVEVDGAIRAVVGPADPKRRNAGDDVRPDANPEHAD